MKYVIDIPEKWVKDLKLNGASTGLGKAVCKGRPLKKEFDEIKAEIESDWKECPLQLEEVLYFMDKRIKEIDK